jgi:hypothetical protein
MEAIWGKQFVGIETYNRRLVFLRSQNSKEEKVSKEREG